jgi:transposase
VRVLAELSAQITAIEGDLNAHFDRHPDATILRFQPGLGPVLAARVLAEFGGDPRPPQLRRDQPDHPRVRHPPIVLARVAANKRLRDALYLQAFTALSASFGVEDRQVLSNLCVRPLVHRRLRICRGRARLTPVRACMGWHTFGTRQPLV